MAEQNEGRSIDEAKERFRLKVEEYSRIILGVSPYNPSSGYCKVVAEEKAVGWAIAIILAGDEWAMRYPIRRVFDFWDAEIQAEAAKQWLLDWRAGTFGSFENKLQQVHYVREVHLRPYEETRVTQRLAQTLGRIIENNRELL